MTTNSTTAAIVNNILNETNKNIADILNQTMTTIEEILNKTNKDVENLLQTSPAPTTNKNWWDGLDIQTYHQSSHTIVGWEMITNTTTYYPLFDVEGDTISTNIFDNISGNIVEHYKLFGGVSLDDEIDLGTRKIRIKAICLDEFDNETDFKKKIYWNGVEGFQKILRNRNRNLKEDLKEIIESEYKYSEFCYFMGNL